MLEKPLLKLNEGTLSAHTMNMFSHCILVCDVRVDLVYFSEGVFAQFGRANY